ncbi:MAG: Cna B-type domain-containing protein, partial [Gallicola sp.]|nr:Cna B-type domain-containing protein [Gallicola sp.]
EFANPIAAGTKLQIRQTEYGKEISDEVAYCGGNELSAGQSIGDKSATPGVISLETPENPIVIKETPAGADPQIATWNVPRTDFFEQNYNYKVIEINVPKNYTDSYTDPLEERDGKGNLTKLTQEVVNTYSPDTIQVTVTKEWKGGPTVKPGFELQLYRTTGTDETTKTAVGAPVALLKETSHTWDVPKKDTDGNAYTYFVEESTLPENYTVDYEDPVEEKDGEGELIKVTQKVINTFAPKDISIPVQKVWIGGSEADRPTEITVGLYVGDVLAKDSDGNDLTLILNKDGEWKGEFTKVKTIDDTLKPVEYQVKETVPEGFKFETTYEGDQERGFRVINTFVQGVKDLNLTKTWVGGDENNRPEVEIQLYRNLVKLGDPVVLNGSEETPWNHTWKDLLVQDRTGAEYIYTVVETKVPENYISEVQGTGSIDDPFVVINTYSPDQITFTANKKWVGGDKDNRPPYAFQLYRQLGTDETTKEAVDNLVFVKGDTHTWENLPAKNVNNLDYT